MLEGQTNALLTDCAARACELVAADLTKMDPTEDSAFRVPEFVRTGSCDQSHPSDAIDCTLASRSLERASSLDHLQQSSSSRGGEKRKRSAADLADSTNSTTAPAAQCADERFANDAQLANVCPTFTVSLGVACLLQTQDNSLRPEKQPGFCHV